jgi:hypothetical protein
MPVTALMTNARISVIKKRIMADIIHALPANAATPIIPPAPAK